MGTVGEARGAVYVVATPIGNLDDLSPRAVVRRGDVAVLAARVGPVRLIDNHEFGARLGPFPPPP